MDEAQLLDAREADALSRELLLYPPALQLQIWIVESLQDEPIENLSIRAVDTWKLGEKGQDRGVLLLVAVKDRTARIEVGRGLEGDIPDITAGRLVRDVLTPAFRQEAYYKGLATVSRYLHEFAQGGKPRLARKSQKIGGIELIVLILFLLLFVGGPFVGIGRRRRRGFFGGSAWGGSSWGGSSWPRGGGSWGGGGGWSGGGGGFGGGGASGKW